MICTRHLTRSRNQKQNHKNTFSNNLYGWMGGCVVFSVCMLCFVFANPLNLYIFSISARGLSTFISYFKICHFNNTHNPVT